MPGPVSATAISTWPSSSRAETSTRPPAGVNLTAFDRRLKTIWRTRRPSALIVISSGSVVSDELDPAAARPFRVHGDRAAQDVRDRHLRELELHPAGLDLGQVEHVVDQREQVRARREHVVDVGELLVVQLAEHLLVQHLGEADDRVQRRAQLVRHRGQEVRLVPARGLQLLIQAPQLVAHPVHVGGECTDLVPVRHLHMPCEVAGRDRGQPPLRLPQRDEDRVGEEQPERESQEKAARAGTDQEIPRAAVRAPVGRDERVRAGLGLPGEDGELLRERSRPPVGTDVERMKRALWISGGGGDRQEERDVVESRVRAYERSARVRSKEQRGPRTSGTATERRRGG